MSADTPRTDALCVNLPPKGRVTDDQLCSIAYEAVRKVPKALAGSDEEHLAQLRAVWDAARQAQREEDVRLLFARERNAADESAIWLACQPLTPDRRETT